MLPSLAVNIYIMLSEVLEKHLSFNHVSYFDESIQDWCKTKWTIMHASKKSEFITMPWIYSITVCQYLNVLVLSSQNPATKDPATPANTMVKPICPTLSSCPYKWQTNISFEQRNVSNFLLQFAIQINMLITCIIVNVFTDCYHQWHF